MFPSTDWHDAARIAQMVRMDIQQVRYHWRRAWMHLDLPPEASGFLDSERAMRLAHYCVQRRREGQKRRKWRQKSTIR